LRSKILYRKICCIRYIGRKEEREEEDGLKVRRSFVAMASERKVDE
jgi:hypothetical protein